ncbi:MAG: putative toxin-antitoxin system toxin component, PIN family [Cyclobacteriaceae bacterium]|nr:putative toxin-antitoxin system toxin component, PIN family [Cyclobacteriaceae bacterium]
MLISAALFKGSVQDKVFDKACGLGNIITSDLLYDELKEVINRTKFDRYFKAGDRRKFLARYKAETKFVVVTHRISKSIDPKDDMFLELALSGKAACIITNDPDLLILHPFENISIISPKEFLEKF